MCGGGGQLFLYMTRRPDLIHIPIKLHVDIHQRSINWKLGKGKQSFLYVTRRPDLIYIPIMYEDNLNDN